MENNSSALDFRLFIPLVLEIQKEDYFKGKAEISLITEHHPKNALQTLQGGSSRAQVLVGGFSAVLQLHFSIPHLSMPMPMPTRLRVQQLLVAGGTWRSRAHGAGKQRSNPVALSAAATLNFICTSPIFGLELSQLFPLAVHS